MLQIGETKGAIFDVDDTLLDNNMHPDPTLGLHSQSRLNAIHAVGELHGIDSLINLTPEENVEGFRSAKQHMLASAVWNILYVKGVVDTDEPDLDHPLVREIVSLKTREHPSVLRTYGKEIKDSSKFIRGLGAHGLTEKLAIASAAVRNEIDIFLEMTSLTSYFTNERIISIENVTRFKLDPQCFDMAFQTLDLPNEDRRKVLAFEDDPRGIQSAKAAGLYVCGITTRFSNSSHALQDAGADIVADSYQDFANLMGLKIA